MEQKRNGTKYSCKNGAKIPKNHGQNAKKNLHRTKFSKNPNFGFLEILSLHRFFEGLK